MSKSIEIFYILMQGTVSQIEISLYIVHHHIEGTVSQIFDLGLSFCFMKSSKVSLKKN